MRLEETGKGVNTLRAKALMVREDHSGFHNCGQILKWLDSRWHANRSECTLSNARKDSYYKSYMTRSSLLLGWKGFEDEAINMNLADCQLLVIKAENASRRIETSLSILHTAIHT